MQLGVRAPKESSPDSFTGVGKMKTDLRGAKLMYPPEHLGPRADTGEGGHVIQQKLLAIALFSFLRPTPKLYGFFVYEYESALQRT